MKKKYIQGLRRQPELFLIYFVFFYCLFHTHIIELMRQYLKAQLVAASKQRHRVMLSKKRNKPGL